LLDKLERAWIDYKWIFIKHLQNLS
jgi:hypothetical protein